MRWVVRIVGALVVLAAVLVGVAFLLPREVTVSRSVVIDAPPEAIWPHVAALEATRAWSPWMTLDPDMQVSFSGPETGVGNRMDWVSEKRNVGTGSQEITAAVEPERVDTALDFGPMGTADATIALAPDGAGTVVTWGFRTDLGTNPVSRWMGLMMDDWVGGDYETGLANLKALVERG